MIIAAMVGSALTPVGAMAQGVEAAEAPETAGDIIVTAQRREQRLTDVPISISAISQETMQNQQIKTTLDLPKLVPGVEVSHNGVWVTPTIRGVGSRVGENSVAQYIDGVYIPNPVSALSEFAAVERVEVLKGPQGTLFGRNATGGAITIITPDPKIGEVEAQGSAFLEERNGWGGTGYVSLPIGDKFALSISGNYRESDGWIKMGVNNIVGGSQPVPAGTPLNAVKHSGQRVKLRFNPDADFDAILTFWHGKLNDSGATVYPAISNQLLGGDVDLPPYRAFVGFVPTNDVEFTQYSLKWTKHFGDTSLQSTTAYRKDDNFINVDVSQSTIAPVQATWASTQKTFSQEFVLNSKIGPLDAVAGLFIYDDRFVKEYIGAFHHQDTFSVAPFIDLTYNITDNLRVIGGLRYTYEKRSFTYDAFDGSVFFKSDKSYNNISPRAVVQYDLDDRSNVYASFSQGYKSGLFNTDATGLVSPDDLAAQPLNAEKLTAYEIGYKRGSRFLNLSLAGFFYKWENIQTNRYVNGNTVAQNAAEGEIYGGEFQLTVNPTNYLSIFVNGAVMHGRFTKFPDGNASVQGTAGDLYDLNNPVDPLVVNVSQDWKGLRLLNAPDLSINGGFNLDIPVGNGTLTLTPNVKYSSRFASNGILLDTSGKNLLERGSEVLVDMSVGYKIGQFKVSAYARNLLDNNFYSEPNYNALGYYGLWNEPRTIGARIEFKY
ncbi:TonB-dependent receptor [Croceicoccus estronivorus]|uniref:TonB-dependent receptor n=1 Tax=Croceicoccus estronivorus TaxID=1172626 RepID=UPI0014796EE3|nr:TonB-dependent receptor [Croceicoccus estronivorus]